MTKTEFLKRLNKSLRAMKRDEREKSVSYYRESIEDRMEEGLGEEEAIATMEDVDVIAQRILADAAGRGALRPKREAVSTVLIVLGSPVWLSLFIALVAAMVAMYVAVWAIIISLFAVLLALAVSALGGVVGLIVFYVYGAPVAFFFLGAGLVCGALAIFCFLPVLSLTKWLIHATAGAWRRVWGRALRKGVNA